MDNLIRPLIPYLPPDLTNILLNPPNLSSPSSFLPLFRLAWPVARYAVVILAFWIVWATLSGMFGYMSRILRFALKIGPILGLVGWLMGNSGQGGMGDVFNVARQWAGMGGAAPAGAGVAPGLASLAGLFTGNPGQESKVPRSGRKSTRNTAPPSGGPDIMSSIFNTAANWMGQGAGEGAAGAGGGGWQNIVQDYVKQAMNAAAEPQAETAEEKRRRRRTGF